MRKNTDWLLGASAFLSVCLFGFVLFCTIPITPASGASSRIEPRPQPRQEATPKTNEPVAIPANARPYLPPNAALHKVARGESLPAIVHRFLPATTYMTGSELEKAIREANPSLAKGIYPKPETELVIPGFEPMPWTEKPVLVEPGFEVRAIYLTGTMAGSARGLEIIHRWRAAGGNAVVFDLKDSDGLLNVPFAHPLAWERGGEPIRNLPKLTRYFHAMGMRAIARIAIFRDESLVKRHPELAVRSRKTGQPWRENGKLVWTDPSRREVWDYNISLARLAAQSGADEVQFDYVRFPAEGDQQDAHFAFEDESKPDAQHTATKRADVIVAFLQRARAELEPLGTLLSLDVFGVMAWERPIDLAHTGQDIARMAHTCDILSPMIYPSHFFHMDGIAKPGDAPEHFIAESMKRFEKTTQGSGVVLRPWLQAFAWRTKTYSPDYIRVQVEVARREGGIGFLFWNARNDYSQPFAAMPEMRRAGAKYFRGDEVQGALRKRGQATGGSSAAPAGGN